MEDKEIINLRFVLVLGLVLFFIGLLGFYLFNGHNWYVSFYDTATTMSLVGATHIPTTNSGKIFAGMYALTIGLGYIFLLSFVVFSLLENQTAL